MNGEERDTAEEIVTKPWQAGSLPLNKPETENTRLRRAVSDLALDKLLLADAEKGKLLSLSRRRVCVDHVLSELGSHSRGLT